MNSEKSDGRSVISNAASGLFKVETARSGIAAKMRKHAASDKVKCAGPRVSHPQQPGRRMCKLCENLYS